MNAEYDARRSTFSRDIAREHRALRSALGEHEPDDVGRALWRLLDSAQPQVEERLVGAGQAQCGGARARNALAGLERNRNDVLLGVRRVHDAGEGRLALDRKDRL